MGRGFNRREFLRLAAMAGAGAGLPTGAAPAATQPPLLMRTIPSSGERIPAVGLGTNAYGVSDEKGLDERREVLKRMLEGGATVIDTAPAYGDSEVVLGSLIAGLGARDRFFLATKVTSTASEKDPGRELFDASLQRLRTDRIDLLQVHNLSGVDGLMPVLIEWKRSKRIRYLGVTTSRVEQHEALLEAMRRHPLDFVQVNYSLGDRAAAEKVLPLARDRGIAVLLNLPFGGRRGSLFRELRDRPLPGYAATLGIASWGQFFLKYAISHPAVTAAIPGTTQPKHFEDNLEAARGPQPDEAQRREMEKTWDAMTA